MRATDRSPRHPWVAKCPVLSLPSHAPLAPSSPARAPSCPSRRHPNLTTTSPYLRYRRALLARAGTSRPPPPSSSGTSGVHVRLPLWIYPWIYPAPKKTKTKNKNKNSDEILNGKTKDSNSNCFARYCFQKGIDLCVAPPHPPRSSNLLFLFRPHQRMLSRQRVEVIPDHEDDM